MPPAPLFRDRRDAGEKLALAVQAELLQLSEGDQTRATEMGAQAIVYALPRGGLMVAEPVARSLRCPLDIIASKKITEPSNPELAIGAITAAGQSLWYWQVTGQNAPDSSRLNSATLKIALQRAQDKAKQQLQQLASGRPKIDPAGALSLIVDDGIATGMTIAAAVRFLQTQAVSQIWICAPVAPRELQPLLQQWSDRAILLTTPSPFYSVSHFYQYFPQVQIDAALACLESHNHSWLDPTPKDCKD